MPERCFYPEEWVHVKGEPVGRQQFQTDKTRRVPRVLKQFRGTRWAEQCQAAIGPCCLGDRHFPQARGVSQESGV